MLISTGVFVVVILSLVIVAGVFLRVRWLKKYAAHQKVEGISYIKRLVEVLIKAQQHRGLTTGYLGGDHSQIGQIETLERDISRLLADIAMLDGFMNNSRFRGITDHWSRLNGQYETLGLASNLTQHNKLITNFLYLIEDVADAHSLESAANTSSTNVRLMQVLQAAEYVGQARAIGTGVSAAGHCDSVARIRLLYLHGQIVNAMLSPSQSSNSGHEAGEPISHFLSVLESMTQVDGELLDAQNYFALATRALDSIFAQVDQEISQLKCPN